MMCCQRCQKYGSSQQRTRLPGRANEQHYTILFKMAWKGAQDNLRRVHPDTRRQAAPEIYQSRDPARCPWQHSGMQPP